MPNSFKNNDHQIIRKILKSYIVNFSKTIPISQAQSKTKYDGSATTMKCIAKTGNIKYHAIGFTKKIITHIRDIARQPRYNLDYLSSSKGKSSPFFLALSHSFW